MTSLFWPGAIADMAYQWRSWCGTHRTIVDDLQVIFIDWWISRTGSKNPKMWGGKMGLPCPCFTNEDSLGEWFQWCAYKVTGDEGFGAMGLYTTRDSTPVGLHWLNGNMIIWWYMWDLHHAWIFMSCYHVLLTSTTSGKLAFMTLGSRVVFQQVVSLWWQTVKTVPFLVLKWDIQKLRPAAGREPSVWSLLTAKMTCCTWSRPLDQRWWGWSATLR